MVARDELLTVGAGDLKPAPARTRKFVPNRGDIIHFDFTPLSGHEMRGPHYGLVLTASAYNSTFGFALVAPITQGAQDLARDAGVAVNLMGATERGPRRRRHCFAESNQMLDLESRNASLVDRVFEDTMEDIKARLHAIRLRGLESQRAR